MLLPGRAPQPVLLRRVGPHPHARPSSAMRRPWVRAGLAAALLSGAPSTLVALRRGDDIFASTEAVGAVLLPRYRKGWARVSAGAVAHLLISLCWARVLERVLRDRDDDAPGAVVAGAAWGAAIALIDIGGIARFLPPIRDLEAGPVVADHVAFGAIAGWVLHRGARRSR